MQRESQYLRFDPITVRAATRLVRLAEAGRLPSWEVSHYLRELAAMEPGAGARARHRLYRMAHRRAALGNAGVAPVFRLRRLSRERAAAPPRRQGRLILISRPASCPARRS
jgi:hypothetical protein